MSTNIWCSVWLICIISTSCNYVDWQPCFKSISWWLYRSLVMYKNRNDDVSLKWVFYFPVFPESDHSLFCWMLITYILQSMCVKPWAFVLLFWSKEGGKGATKLLRFSSQILMRWFMQFENIRLSPSACGNRRSYLHV